eukprot:COSAG06_NODE_5348_length_3535_cov_5.362340_3_plen_165_part_01
MSLLRAGNVTWCSNADGVHKADGPDTCPTYAALNNETPSLIATKLGVDAKEIVALNKESYPGLRLHAKLKAQTVLRLPTEGSRREDEHDDETSATNAGSENDGVHKADGPDTCPTYAALNNETPTLIATKLGLDAKEIVALNKESYPGLRLHAKLKAQTVLRLPT